MFLRIDRLQIELPQPKDASPDSAAAVQELLGGRFGEMSTLMNYMYQSFNFRGRAKLKPYYDLIGQVPPHPDHFTPLRVAYAVIM